MDLISNMLTQIRNSSMVQKETCRVPASKVTEKIALILKQRGFIKDVKRKIEDKKPFLDIKLRYINEQPVITSIKRISRSSRRIYENHKKLRSPKFGIVIVSTSKGIMTAQEAKKKQTGGEIICQIR